jgi:hypothetical protein
MQHAAAGGGVAPPPAPRRAVHLCLITPVNPAMSGLVYSIIPTLASADIVKGPRSPPDQMKNQRL